MSKRVFDMFIFNSGDKLEIFQESFQDFSEIEIKLFELYNDTKKIEEDKISWQISLLDKKLNFNIAFNNFDKDLMIIKIKVEDVTLSDAIIMDQNISTVLMCGVYYNYK